MKRNWRHITNQWKQQCLCTEDPRPFTAAQSKYRQLRPWLNGPMDLHEEATAYRTGEADIHLSPPKVCAFLCASAWGVFSRESACVFGGERGSLTQRCWWESEPSDGHQLFGVGVDCTYLSDYMGMRLKVLPSRGEGKQRVTCSFRERGHVGNRIKQHESRLTAENRYKLRFKLGTRW